MKKRQNPPPKKKTKKKKQKNIRISIYSFWVICDLMVNYMEIQDFVTLDFFTVIHLDSVKIIDTLHTILSREGEVYCPS